MLLWNAGAGEEGPFEEAWCGVRTDFYTSSLLPGFGGEHEGVFHDLAFAF